MTFSKRSITALFRTAVMPPARIRSKKVVRRKDIQQQPTPPIQHDSTDEFNGVESDDPMVKDENEFELERTVFGDDAGFRADLALHKTTYGLADDGDEEKVQENNYEVNDGERGLEDGADAEVKKY